MERLQKLLRDYNRLHLDEKIEGYGWVSQYQGDLFPEYWKRVFKISELLPKDCHILEIGSGYGFISSIFIYLGFSKITCFEMNRVVAGYAKKRLDFLFPNNNCIIWPEAFRCQETTCDILVLVNCVYYDECSTKTDYIDKLKGFYIASHSPKII